MKVPQLTKKPELKSCHNVTWEDNYSWIHQNNILEVLKDSSKLSLDVRKYLEEENNYTEEGFDLLGEPNFLIIMGTNVFYGYSSLGGP